MAIGERLGKQSGDNRSHRSAFLLMDGFDLSQNRVINIERRPHDA